MFLSRIQLTDAIAQDSQLGKLLQRNSYGMHSLLWDLFETGDRFLFREENTREQLNSERNKPLYYVLSASEPKRESPLFDVQTKSFQPQLRIGDTLRFKLRANPIVARRKEGEKNSRKHDVVMDAQHQFLVNACTARGLSIDGQKRQLKGSLLNHSDYQGAVGNKQLQSELDDAINKSTVKWLSNRGEGNGFILQSIQATGYRWNALPEKGRDAGFSSIDYEGVLMVTDPENMLKIISRGMGPAKAFGCGLILIRRI